MALVQVSFSIADCRNIFFFFLVDFTNQLKDGCLCLYSIKNPAFPEYAVMTDSPIIALDVYKETPYMICVGKLFGYLVLPWFKKEV